MSYVRQEVKVKADAVRALHPTGKMLVQVTPHCIAGGKRSNLRCCPVALAMGEVLGFDEGNTSGSWVRANCGLRYRLAPEITERIYHFDKTGKMEPFEFEIDVTTAMEEQQ